MSVKVALLAMLVLQKNEFLNLNLVLDLIFKLLLTSSMVFPSARNIIAAWYWSMSDL